MNPSLLLVDDHEIVRRGCRELLTHAGYHVGHEAATGEEAWRLFRAHAPRLVILDLSMEHMGGLEIIRRVRAHRGHTAVLVFTMHDEPTYATRALKAGALGYITKTSPPESLIEGIERVLGGSVYLSQDIAQAIALSELSIDAGPVETLSAREFEVFQLLVEGHSNPRIAATLSLSHKSVSNYVVRIKHKLAADSVADLVRLAINQGLTKQNVGPLVDGPESTPRPLD
ncbi:LuxR family transcriptional regulator [Salinisphaera orenii MK-B5]|uniref:LuxR family transcriptional regulator n=2 Tax=Salinisphaera orenii TaxID=856731 RepID=A0A423PFT4_9GAMM|nr:MULTISPECIES: response regulator transcription factor [Salinisphaera]ROO24491.1 LuxR family transcriptional regulator [Salinisphaera orenii MK-B5]ROO27895.1 LuxR family transcriptional regulator [Salinisphaera halophila YIM 95161]